MIHYPSLLYQNPPTLPKMDAVSVFEDLQLLNFLTPEAAETVAIPCEGENIDARRALMREWEEPAMRKALDALYDSICALCEVFGRYRECRCESETKAVFAVLMERTASFITLAAQFPGQSPLAVRFREHFIARRKEAEDAGLLKQLAALEPLWDTLTAGTFTVHEKQMKLRGGTETSYLSRIAVCGEKLGLEPLPTPGCPARQLSPAILTVWEKLYPDVFAACGELYTRFASAFDPAITEYRRQLSYYRDMLALLDRVRDAGIPLCYPERTETPGVEIHNAYDISLLAKGETHIVPNDIRFDPESPFFYLTGANGGGKTTYLRTVGIALLFFLLGCPVPCEGGRACPPDAIFTHFPRDERFDGSGRFVEEQTRVQKILSAMTPRSLVLLNETYSSTNEENAVIHTVKLAEELYSRGVFGLYITHQHGIGKTEIPYLNVLIDRDDANRRTFKVARQKNTGGSFARDILLRYDLTPEALDRRFPALDGREGTA